LGFADLKKKTGIQSSGHLQHHLNKLGSLVKTDEYGRYCLSDQGKDALLTVGTVEDAANPTGKQRSRRHVSVKKLAALLLIGIIATTLVTTWTYDRINTHEKWATMLREAQNFHVHMDEHEIDDAMNALSELETIDQDHISELSQIDSFIMGLHNPDFNESKLPATERTIVGEAIFQVGDKVIDAYGNILNYTSINLVTGPPFWYFGPSSPNESMLKEGANIAVNAEAIVNNYSH
jgi:hypothetical protein